MRYIFIPNPSFIYERINKYVIPEKERYPTCIVSNTISEEMKTVSAIHEFGHMLGIEDHYDSNITLEPGQSDECIYGLDKINYNTVSRIVLCESCRNIISEQINQNRIS